MSRLLAMTARFLLLLGALLGTVNVVMTLLAAGEHMLATLTFGVSVGALAACGFWMLVPRD